MSAVISPKDFTVRAMRDTDISEIMCIERNVYDFPWTQQIFLDCLRVGYHCFLCEQDGEITAYSILSSGAGEAHLLNICVKPEFQGQGIGRQLLMHLFGYIEDKKVESLFLEVRPSNRVAIGLYESLGFNQIGIRKDYYPAKMGREDAIILGLTLF